MVSPVPAEEVLARLDPAERGWVEEFRTAVRARYGARVRDLRLFGSKVRGDDHDESDIDVLAGLIEEAAAFIERDRRMVDEAAATGPDEDDPPPDY